MIIATTIAGIFLAIATIGATIRVVLGPTVADRMVALDTLLFIGVGALGVYTARTGDMTYLPVLVVAVVTAFVSTIVVARYIEAETGQ